VAKRPAPFNNPFADAGAELKARVKAEHRKRRKDPTQDHRPAVETRHPTPRPSPPPVESDPAVLFAQHVGSVRRLEDPRGSVPLARPDPTALPQRFAPEEEEAYEELVALVEGRSGFDIADSDEFIRGGVEGLDRRILRKLQRGEFSYRRHLDLHGFTRDAAKEAVEDFIIASREAQERCVLIVHGRGLNSKDKIPVLKEALRSWLARGRIGRSVLAFCTARPHDGGAGAMYVLLRR